MTNMDNKKKPRKESNPDSKLELANKIAKQSKKVANTYAHFEDSLFRIIRSFSSWIDNVLFNQRFSLIVSLGLAILLYMTVNFNSQNSLFGSPLLSAKTLTDIPIVARYNTDTFEITGLPTSADITITGEGSNVNAAANQKGTLVANLEGLTEGQHTVKLTPEGYSDNVTIKVDPSDVTVTLKKKSTGQFDIGYDFINQDKMNSIYSLGTPEFEYSKVNVRTSKDTLDSIAFIKALIDVTNVESDFEQEATLVAYDKKGIPVNADIVPNTVKVKVPVTSPNKTVPIRVETSGEVPNGMAIETITMDHESVTIYASESVLSKINEVGVTLDASTLTKDSTVLRPITLPTGVKSSSISQISMDVKLGPGVSRILENVPVFYKNNVGKYKFSILNNQSTVNVELFGTQANVDAINPEDVVVYFDMKNAVPGNQEFKLSVEQPVGSLVRYSVTQPTIQVTVSGEVDNTVDESVGIN
ncbi:MAG: YbbR-like domain-containing protein [Anaerorhabdus sp.]|uniref:CdaR family protein n=1 Tax=Anaerorhabdus sp. TaxID=1872524 RepID=UPI003A8C17AC